jgi:hypothetical protein
VSPVGPVAPVGPVGPFILGNCKRTLFISN